jgi:hypothetical protein
MEFFEFFFSGPGWGWKVFALICFTSVICEAICRLVNIVFEYKIKKCKEEIKTTVESISKCSGTCDVEGTPATKDDVRS